MKHAWFPILLLLCFAQSVDAQSQFRIKGAVTDTLISTPLYLSSVVMIRAGDSVIEAFTRVDDNGNFSLSVNKKGKYVLQISHPGYAEYAELIDVKDSVLDMGEIAMLSEEHLLEEFVFTAQVAKIKIKGDTTEYMADSFNVKGGASVEDLLKKLPGIRVDKNGKITAQGQTVEKVLVDGEEFFSDDPKVVTQGIQAGAVERVQVYDKKSDQAEFTGIDDGEKTRTINLKLKENMKKGFFGKLEAGGGSDGYYQNQGMVNAFKGKRQFAAFGIISNTDKVGLGWGDNQKFGSGPGMTEVDDDGSVTTYISGGDDFAGWNGTYRGDGLPRVWTGGTHFANKWNEERQHLSGSYRYALQQVAGTGGNSKIYALADDTTRINTETKDQFNSIDRHSLNGIYEWRFDSTGNSSLKLSVDGGLKHSTSSSIYHTEAYNRVEGNDEQKTLNDRTTTSAADEQRLNMTMLFRKKFDKKGRTLSIDFSEYYTDASSDGHLNATTGIAGSANPSVIDQKKITASNSIALKGKAVYTEPLSKVAFLMGNYQLTINNSTSLNSSFNQSPGGGDYTELQDSFSSNYRYNILINQGGLGLNFVFKKVRFSFGSNISNSAFTQTDLLRGDSTVEYNYINLFPKASFNYKVSRQKSFNFSYNGSTRQPNINQIQPLQQNTDPLNIVVGNPNLKQEFTNRFNLGFNSYKTLKEQYLYSGLSFSTVSNAISTAQEVVGAVYRTQYINVDGNYNGNFWSGYSFKIKKPELHFWLSMNANAGRVNSIVNGVKNTSINNSYSFSPTISYEKEDKYEVSWNPGVTYNDNRSTINTAQLNYWVLNNEFSAGYMIVEGFEIGSSINIMRRQKTEVFTQNNSIAIWNAYISKKFLKSKTLELKMHVFDILNQNLGYSRTAQGNTITQNNYTTIRRYGMLSLIWNFKHSPAAANSAEE